MFSLLSVTFLNSSATQTVALLNPLPTRSNTPTPTRPGGLAKMSNRSGNRTKSRLGKNDVTQRPIAAAADRRSSVKRLCYHPLPILVPRESNRTEDSFCLLILPHPSRPGPWASCRPDKSSDRCHTKQQNTSLHLLSRPEHGGDQANGYPMSTT